MKKYIILTAALLSGLCACTKKDADIIELPDTPIAFQAFGYASQTKAEGTFTNEDFSVFGYQHSLSWNAATAATGDDLPSTLMKDIKVTHSENNPAYSTVNGGDVWAPAQVYYWPKKDFLTFAAYSPYGKGSASFSFEKGIKFAAFTVNPVPGDANKVDLLYSDIASDKTVENYTSGTHDAHPDGVYLLFHHALAQIKIACTFDDTKLNPGTEAVVNVYDIKVRDIDTKGTSFNATDKEWTSSEPKTQDLGITPADLSTKASNFISEYYVMPQTLEDGTQQIVVSYTITTTFSDGTTKTEKIEEKAVDFTCDIDEWSPNYKYSYNLKISAVSDDPITFDPAVEAWSEEEAESINY